MTNIGNTCDQPTNTKGDKIRKATRIIIRKRLTKTYKPSAFTKDTYATSKTNNS